MMKVKARGLLHWIQRHHPPCEHLRSMNLTRDLRTNRVGLWVNHFLNRNLHKKRVSGPVDAGEGGQHSFPHPSRAERVTTTRMTRASFQL